MGIDRIDIIESNVFSKEAEPAVEQFSFNLHNYGEPKTESVLNLAGYVTAIKLLRDEFGKGEKFISSGYRNDTAVNTSIALHVLGYDPAVWFGSFFNEWGGRFTQIDRDEFEKHLERVADYLDSWGPEGEEDQALEYAL